MKLSLNTVEVQSLVMSSKPEKDRTENECSTETCNISGCDICDTLRGPDCWERKEEGQERKEK